MEKRFIENLGKTTTLIIFTLMENVLANLEYAQYLKSWCVLSMMLDKTWGYLIYTALAVNENNAQGI